MTGISENKDIFSKIRHSPEHRDHLKSTNEYFRMKIRIHLLAVDIRFLNLCKINRVFPNFISNSFKKLTSNKEFLQKKLLQKTISDKYRERSILENRAYSMHLRLGTHFGPELWGSFERHLYTRLSKEKHNKKNTLKKKLAVLCNKIYRPKCKQPAPDNVINLSRQKLTGKELEILGQGLKSCYSYPTEITEYIADIDNATRGLNENEKFLIHQKCIPILESIGKQSEKEKKVHNDRRRVISNLKKKGLYITKSDKGNNTVIMEKTDYIQRCNLLLENGNFKKVKKNPLSAYKKELKYNLDRVSVIPETEKKWLTNTTAELPYLYAYPKIHKPGKEMRPIVNCREATTYKLAKWLIKRFKLFEIFESKSVRNSIELVEKLKNIKLEIDDRIVSFDVKSLYPSIPVNLALDTLRNWLHKNGISSMKIKEYAGLVNLCLTQNAFYFNNELYEQLDGLMMGNPISSLTAELVMSEFECRAIKEYPKIFQHWSRFVDDVLEILKKHHINEALTILNSYHEKIQFTLEVEEEQKLPFLDLIVHRDKDNLKFGIYRKPTSTETYINNRAFNHRPHKLAAFNFMLHRTNSIPLNETDYKIEIEKILEIAEKNSFNKGEIKKLNEKVKQRTLNKETSKLNIEKAEMRFKKFSYHPKYAPAFRRIFEKFNIKLSFTNRFNVAQQFSRKIENRRPDNEEKGIYQINCTECNKFYIGQTSRSLKVRAQEHKRCVRNRQTEKSAVALHYWEEGHEISFEPKLLRKVTEKNKLDIWESIYMYQNKNNIFNTDLTGVNNRLFTTIHSRCDNDGGTGNNPGPKSADWN